MGRWMRKVECSEQGLVGTETPALDPRRREGHGAGPVVKGGM